MFFSRAAKVLLLLALAPVALAACSSGGGGGAASSSSSSSGQVSLEVTGLSSSVAAGTATTFAVVARDGSGAVATGYTGTVAFSSTDTQATLPSSFTYTTTDRGTHFFQGGLTLRTSGSQTLTVVDQSFSQVTGSKSVNVTAGAASALKLALASSEASNVSFSAGTLKAVDSFGNTVSFDASSDNVTITATPSGGTLSGLGSAGGATLNRASDFVAGTATLAGKLKFVATPGTFTFSATSATGKTSNAVAVTIFSAPAATTSLEVQGFTSTLLAGDATTLVVIARDSNGSISTSYAGTVTFTSNDPLATLPATYPFNATDSGVHVFANGVTLRSAGARTITVRDVAAASLTAAKSLTVTAGALAAFTVAVPPTLQRENELGSGSVTAIDSFGNTITAFNPTSDAVVISVSPADGDISNLSAPGDTLLAGDFVQGSASLAHLRYSGALGVHTFTATSASGKTGTSAGVDIGGLQLNYLLSGLPISTDAGTVNQLFLIVRDNLGTPVPGYVGTVAFTSSDPQATLPQATSLTAADHGFKNLQGIVLRTAGVRTITARDASDPSVFGTVSTTVTPAPLAKFALVLPATQRQGTAFPAGATLTALDGFNNKVDYSASGDPVSITASPTGGTISGLSGTGSNQINGTGSFVFVNGTASLSSMVFSGPEGNYTFTARSLSGFSGSAAVSIENPVVFGFAEYVDVNRNAVADAGDTLTISFGTPVSVSATATTGDLRLPVSGDSFGDNATVAAVAGSPTLVRVTLGANATLRTRNTFDGTKTSARSPSGVDVFPGQTTIRATRNGVAIAPATPVDIIPGFGDAIAGLASNQFFITAAITGDFNHDGLLDVFCAGGTNSTDVRTLKMQSSGDFIVADTHDASIPSTAIARAIAGGDFNRDDVPDAVVAVSGGRSSYFQAAPVSGILQLAVALPNAATVTTADASLDARAVAVGDMDEDGDLDIVLGHASGQGTRVIATSGATTANLSFDTTTFLPISSGDVRAIAVGDVTGDGHLDILIGGTDGPIRILENNFGDFTFLDIGTVSTAGTVGLALGDVDLDGDLDIVEARADGFRIHLNSGAGAFTTSQAGLVPDSAPVFTLADFDGDGDLDVIYGGATASGVLVNGRTTGFVKGAVTIPHTGVRAIAAADFDRDGDLDFIFGTSVVTGTPTPSPDHLRMGSVSGTWGRMNFSATPSQTLTTSVNVEGMAVADLDNDGDVDIATASNTSGGGTGNGFLRVYRNDGTGSFTSMATLPSFVARGFLCLSAADTDRDGDVDLVTGDGAQRLRVYENFGSLTFRETTTLAITASTGGGDSPCQAQPIDLDQDGDIDIGFVISSASGTLQLMKNAGVGIFDPPAVLIGSTVGSATNLRALAIARSPSQGQPFVTVTSDGNGDGIRVFTTDTLGQPKVINTFGVGDGHLNAVALGDVNRDGKLDFVAGQANQDPRFYRNDSSGTFGVDYNTFFRITLASASTSDPIAIALADLDQDGDLDVVTVNFAGDSVKVYLNNGSGSFVDTFTLPLGGGASNADGTVVAADVDGDGDLDLIVTRNSTSTGGVFVFKNQ